MHMLKITLDDNTKSNLAPTELNCCWEIFRKIGMPYRLTEISKLVQSEPKYRKFHHFG